jgi:hypothetical protein
MLATRIQPPIKPQISGENAREMSLDAINTELATLAPQIGQLHQAIADQQAQLSLMKQRAYQLMRAAKAKNPEFKSPQGLSVSQQVDVHVVGGPSYLEHMMRDWRSLVIDAIEINPNKLREKIAPFIVEREGNLQFIEGVNLPLVPIKVEVLDCDYSTLAALPEPTAPAILVQPEKVSDPLDESLEKKG